MEQVDCVVIGAGVVGLAVAREMAMAGREVVVLEAEKWIGTHTSSRNSEVIHAGIYYAKNSLKARACVSGKALLYRYCDEHGVSTQRCGKLIVATSADEVPKLAEVQAKARANGVDLTLLERDEVRAREPALECLAALESPTTGIIDSHGLMLAYQGDAEAHGAMLAFESPVAGGRFSTHEKVLEVASAEPMTIQANLVVNAAGLWAPEVARRIAGIAAVPPAYFCKGNYYSLAGKAPFSRLIYPMHNHAGLGVHLTLDLGGQARFGPDTEWVDGIDYAVDPKRADGFYAEIRKYWPALPDGALSPSYAGIRPKITAPHEAAADFVLQGEAQHGIAGLVNMYAIESPGLTASLALAQAVRQQLLS